MEAYVMGEAVPEPGIFSVSMSHYNEPWVEEASQING